MNRLGSNQMTVQFQVGPNSWLHMPLAEDQIESVQLSLDWGLGTFVLYINGNEILSKRDSRSVTLDHQPVTTACSNANCDGFGRLKIDSSARCPICNPPEVP